MKKRVERVETKKEEYREELRKVAPMDFTLLEKVMKMENRPQFRKTNKR